MVLMLVPKINIISTGQNSVHVFHPVPVPSAFHGVLWSVVEMQMRQGAEQKLNKAAKQSASVVRCFQGDEYSKTLALDVCRVQNVFRTKLLVCPFILVVSLQGPVCIDWVSPESQEPILQWRFTLQVRVSLSKATFSCYETQLS